MFTKKGCFIEIARKSQNISLLLRRNLCPRNDENRPIWSHFSSRTTKIIICVAFKKPMFTSLEDEVKRNEKTFAQNSISTERIQFPHLSSKSRIISRAIGDAHFPGFHTSERNKFDCPQLPLMKISSLAKFHQSLSLSLSI